MNTHHPSTSLTSPGSFVVGCNYWASHAGTRMWSDWRPGNCGRRPAPACRRPGCRCCASSRLWPDFQPLTLLRAGGGQPREYRLGEEPLPRMKPGRRVSRQRRWSASPTLPIWPKSMA